MHPLAVEENADGVCLEQRHLPAKLYIARYVMQIGIHGILKQRPYEFKEESFKAAFISKAYARSINGACCNSVAERPVLRKERVGGSGKVEVQVLPVNRVWIRLKGNGAIVIYPDAKENIEHEL